MSDIVTVAIIAATPGLLSAIGYFVVHKKTNELKLHINSRMDQLLEISNAAKFEEGKIEGRSEAITKQPPS